MFHFLSDLFGGETPASQQPAQLHLESMERRESPARLSPGQLRALMAQIQTRINEQQAEQLQNRMRAADRNFHSGGLFRG